MAERSRRLSRASWAQFYRTAPLCGIGFLLRQFIGWLAFANPLLVDEVKIGVLANSVLSAVAGAAVLMLAEGLRSARPR